MNFLTTGVLDSLTDWIAGLFHQHTILLPIFLITFDEAGFPLPLGDFIVTYTGYQIAQGKISFLMAFFLLLVPILIGATFLYFLSVRFGERIVLSLGKYIDLDKEKLKKVEEKYKKYGPLVIIFGRHIPGFRVPITIFSGISGIPYRTFILSVFISVVFWIPAYLSIGMKLGPKAVHFAHAQNGLLLFLLIPVILIILGIVLLRKRNNQKKNSKKTKK